MCLKQFQIKQLQIGCAIPSPFDDSVARGFNRLFPRQSLDSDRASLVEGNLNAGPAGWVDVVECFDVQFVQGGVLGHVAHEHAYGAHVLDSVVVFR